MDIEYSYKTYAKETNRVKGEHRFATISDLNLERDISHHELNDLFLSIYDKYPECLFLLGNMFPYYYLEDKEFKKKILNLYKLFLTITRVYVVFGETDYKLADGSLVEKERIDDFYRELGICVLDNRIERINGISLIGYNRDPNLYRTKNMTLLKKDIMGVISTVEQFLNKDTYKIFLTNSHRDLLKLELDFFNSIDMIISGQLPKPKEIKTQGLFERLRDREDHNLLETNGLTIIGNGGVNVDNEKNFNQGEVDLIRIKQKKR